MRKLTLVFFLLISSVSTVNAAVWINEISPSTNPEWVELYNDGSSTVDLIGWLLEDGNSSHSDDLPLSGTIGAGSYLVFNHADGWLNNSGDTLKLYNNASPSAIVDQYTYGTVATDKTIARSPSGSENWVISAPTQGTANAAPSPSPTPTPTATSTPTPTPTTTPSPSPSPTPKPSPSVKPSPSPSPSSLGEVAGVATSEINLEGFGVSPSPSASSRVEPAKLSLNQSRAKTALMTGLGLIVLSVASYVGYKQYLSRNAQTDL